MKPPIPSAEGAVAKFNTRALSKSSRPHVRVAGFGLNLQSARRAIFLETDWTSASIDQAIARLYRAGQTRPVRISILTVAWNRCSMPVSRTSSKA